MSKIQFRLAARTDAAGKYNPNAPLEGNEDNMFVDTNLNSDQKGWSQADEVVDLTELGCLMVVADGMGGMNAGEVASDIAVKTVAEYFSPQRLAGKSFRDSRARSKYLEEVVEAADAAIKADARSNKEHEGMGSTIIMGWLCDGQICLTWCGDSRAYLFRPGRGFWQVSKDHSYVQGLVDDGKITMDEAFDHPYGNIITRSLGDPEKRAKADSKVFPVFEGDIFMLCSDGLSGVLRDHKTYVDGERIETENLEDIIAAHRASMAECRDELFAAAERNDWYDNVTGILCEIVKGEALPSDMKEPPVVYSTPAAKAAPEASAASDGGGMSKTSFHIRKKNLPIIIAAAVLLLAAVGFLVWRLALGSKPTNDNDYFAYCKDHPTIENYRSYVQKFPDGAFVDLAKNWINDWVVDSANKANEADKANEAKGLKDANRKSEEPKSEPKKEDPKKEKDKAGIVSEEKNEDDQKHSKEDDKSKPKLVSADDGLKDSKKGLKDKTELVPNNPVPLSPSKSVDLNENEAYMACLREGATVETCVYWMDKYGKKGERDEGHWNSVRQIFGRLYKTRAKSCDTKQKCQNFLDQHDQIMLKSRMKGTPLDSEVYKIVKDKYSELSKDQGDSSSSSSDRPQPGTNSAPANKKTYTIPNSK